MQGARGELGRGRRMRRGEKRRRRRRKRRRRSQKVAHLSAKTGAHRVEVAKTIGFHCCFAKMFQKALFLTMKIEASTADRQWSTDTDSLTKSARTPTAKSCLGKKV